MTPLDVVRDALARVVWIREEPNPYDREIALEDLEHDLAGWLARAEARLRADIPAVADTGLQEAA